MSALPPDRSLVEPTSKTAGHRSAPGVDPATEVAALAALLAEAVQLTDTNAPFPSRWAQLAEVALEHDSVRAALEADQTDESTPGTVDTPPLSTEYIIARLNGLHDLIGDGHARS